MLLYHNSAACWNLTKKSASKSKSKCKSGNSVKKGYKGKGKSQPSVIKSKTLNPPRSKKVKKSNKKLSKKNQQFLEGLGLKVKQ